MSHMCRMQSTLANYSRQVCQDLGKFGGAITRHGEFMGASVRVGTAGFNGTDVIYMQNTLTGSQTAFYLNAKTGEYGAGDLRLWSFAELPPQCLPLGMLKLGEEVLQLVNKFVGLVLQRPAHADPELLRQLVRDIMPNSPIWVKYWATGTRRAGGIGHAIRFRPNIWPTRKRGSNMAPDCIADPYRPGQRSRAAQRQRRAAQRRAQRRAANRTDPGLGDSRWVHISSCAYRHVGYHVHAHVLDGENLLFNVWCNRMTHNNILCMLWIFPICRITDIDYFNKHLNKYELHHVFAAFRIMFPLSSAQSR